MLNSYDKGLDSPSPGGSLRPSDQTQGVEEAKPGTVIARSVVARVVEQRWIVLLFALILFILSFVYRLPWEAETVALVAAIAGAALIPRSAEKQVTPKEIAETQPPEPLHIAASVIDALPEPAILLSRDGTILFANSKARDLFGGLRPGLHISSATRSPQVLDAVMDCGPEEAQRTVTFSERVPVERYMAATVSHLEAATGSGPFALLFLRDLTEQRRLDQLRSDFIANASHEIKTPLSSLLGFIETLQGAARYDEAARDRFLPIMAKQGERMARLIDNLMSLSRVEMRAHLKPRDVVVISELVQHTCDALEPMASEANIDVQVHSELHDVQVLGDHDELTQVFINLIHNAIKYGRPGGRVVVKLERQKSGASSAIAISIEDDGPGIPAQHLPRLTERFYRVPGSPAMEKGGTGLGLAIVKHVVNRHRGELRISSTLGAGTKFTVLLAEHVQMEGRAELKDTQERTRRENS
jgi:two-component system phosphate regulon sensor histidine kinase PhoR